MVANRMFVYCYFNRLEKAHFIPKRDRFVEATNEGKSAVEFGGGFEVAFPLPFSSPKIKSMASGIRETRSPGIPVKNF